MATLSETPEKQKKLFDIAIVGGGITGLVLAISLLKHDVPVTIYESAAKFGEIGAGVGFGPNAVRAMKLISPDIYEGFTRCLTHGWDSKKDVWFQVRVGDERKADATPVAGDDAVKLITGKGAEKFKVCDTIFEVNFTDKGSQRGAAHRAHFLDQMVKLIPDGVAKFGKRLIDIKRAGEARGITRTDGGGGGEDDAILCFADGTMARHSAVLGTDGIKSKAREILLGKDAAEAVFTGKYVYRGLIPISKAIELVGEERAMNNQLHFGYHGHVITFPIEKGRTMNVVAFSSRESEEWTDPEWVVRTTKEAMLEDFRSWGPSITAIIAAMETPIMWALFNHKSAPTYFGTQPLVCLVGDAAHASTPHQGSGAGMCIEDCYIISNLIAESKTAGDLGKAFAAFDAVRRPRTQKLVETSREAAMLYEFELEGDDLEAIERNLKQRMSWIWDIDLPAELEKALSVFRSSA